MMVDPSLASLRSPARRRRRCSATVLAAVLGCVAAGPADAQVLSPTSPSQAPRVGATIADFVAEASQRFAIPEGWIAAVMRAESAFDPRATSPKGAMGLMQLMPDTWAALRVRLGLGPDPYDPRDNILAGARYMRDLYDQFGAGGFLAAYNAGPGRYLDFMIRARPLPGETRAYVAKVGAAINGETPITAPVRGSVAIAPPQPGIFVVLAATWNGVPAAAPRPADEAPEPSNLDPAPATVGLFIEPWGKTR